MIRSIDKIILKNRKENDIWNQNLTVFTLGIYFPWAVSFKQRWIAYHTTIDGKRLVFKGHGAQLFGNYIKWFLLTIITLGIYGFWLTIKMRQWVVKHTHFKA